MHQSSVTLNQFKSETCSLTNMYMWNLTWQTIDILRRLIFWQHSNQALGAHGMLSKWRAMQGHAESALCAQHPHRSDLLVSKGGLGR